MFENGLLSDKGKVFVGKIGVVAWGILIPYFVFLLCTGSDKQKEIVEISLAWYGVMFFTFLSWATTVSCKNTSGYSTVFAMIFGMAGVVYNFIKL